LYKVRFVVISYILYCQIKTNITITNQKGYWESAWLTVRTYKNDDSFKWVSYKFNNIWNILVNFLAFFSPYPSSTKTSYIGFMLWLWYDPIILYRPDILNNNGPILAASRWFTDDQWWVKCWILHLVNIISTTEKWFNCIKTLIQYWAYVDCLNSKYWPNIVKW